MNAKDAGRMWNRTSAKVSLRVLSGHKDGNVFMEFGKAVKWLAMPPEHAAQLASLLTDHAQAVKG